MKLLQLYLLTVLLEDMVIIIITIINCIMV